MWTPLRAGFHIARHEGPVWTREVQLGKTRRSLHFSERWGVTNIEVDDGHLSESTRSAAFLDAVGSTP